MPNPTVQRPGDLSGVVVTADALHVHRRNVEQILERNGEYVLTVKRNQPILRNSIKALFADADGAFPPCTTSRLTAATAATRSGRSPPPHTSRT